MPVNYIIDYSFNPAILASRDEIHFQSNLLPSVGDYLFFQEFRVKITDVEYKPGEIRPVHVKVTGDSYTLTIIRELLTFRTME